jgi:putative ABC transport system permease protein
MINHPRLLINSFVLRDLRLNWVRSALTIVGIALGVAVMLAINLANGTTLSRFADSIDLISGKANLQIRTAGGGDLDERVLSNMRALWDQNVLFTPVIDQLVVIPGQAQDVVEVLGVDMFADPAFRPFHYDGAVAQESFDDNAIFGSGAVYIGERFAQRYGLSRGSTFSVLANDKRQVLRVAGIISYSGPGKTFGGNLLLMDIGPAQELFDMHGRISRAELIVPEGLLTPVKAQLQTSLPVAVQVESPSRRGQQVEKMLAAFHYNLTALSLIALLVGMFVIYNTMSITVIRKRAEIGVLRAIGVSRLRIFGLFLVKAIILGACGSLVGLAGGLLFAGYAVKAVSTTVQALYVDQPPATISLSWQMLALAFSFGMFMTIVASLAPIFEAVSVPPAEATRRASYERRVERGSPMLAIFGIVTLLAAGGAALAPPLWGLPVFGYVSAALTIFGVAFCMPIVLSFLGRRSEPLLRLWFGTEGKLAILSLNSTLGRTSVTVASLMLGISMMVSLAIMIGSFRQTVIVWVQQSLKADLYVAPLARATSKRAGRLSPSTVEAIRRLPGVADVDAFVEVPFEYNGSQANLGAGELDVLVRHGGLMLVGGQDSGPVEKRLGHESACVVSEAFALHNNVHAGEKLTLPSPGGPWQVAVAGIYYDYASDGGYVIVPRWLYRQHYPDWYSTTLGVYVQPGGDLEQLRSAMVQALGADTSLSIRTNGELRKEVLRVFDNTFAITYALHAISILVAILGVMNALLAMTYELRREFTILSYLGASCKQIRKIILVQAGTLGLLGNVFGMTVGFVLSLLLIHVINKQSFGWTVQLSIPWAFLSESFVLIMLFSVASGWLPAVAAIANLSPEAVRVE